MDKPESSHIRIWGGVKYNYTPDIVERRRKQRQIRDKKNPRYAYRRTLFLKSMYGMTIEEYASRLEAQHGVCAICGLAETATRNGKPRKLCVDHNHKTNSNRGLLCSKCNFMIGLAGEDRSILQKAIKYLRKHGE